jgi:hypothetical protein
LCNNKYFEVKAPEMDSQEQKERNEKLLMTKWERAKK